MLSLTIPVVSIGSTDVTLVYRSQTLISIRKLNPNTTRAARTSAPVVGRFASS